MKRWTCLLLAALLLLTPAMALEQPTDEELKISAPSAILMERSTGTVLYEKNGDEHHCQYDLHRCIPVLSL